jgi:hypothetical protein
VEGVPWRSSGDIAPEFGTYQPRVLEMLHDVKLHPYYYSPGAYLFPDDRPVRMQYFEWLRYQRTANGRITFCGQTKSVLRVSVCSTSTTVTCGQGINLTLFANVGIKFASESVWTGIVGDIVVGPDLPSDRLKAQRYRDYLETVVPGMFEEMPLAVKQSL